MVETHRQEINPRLLKFCYDPATSAASSKGIFSAAINNTNQDKKCRQYEPLSVYFLNDVYGLSPQTRN
jgi:hypothetical protein